MKKVLIAIPIFVISFGLLMTAIGALLPRDYSVERSMFIEAEPDEVFAHIEDLEAWDEWSYWTTENIDGLEVTMGDVKVGKGARKEWTEKGVPGSLTITEHRSEAGEMMIETETQFGDYPTMVSVMTVKATKQEITEEDGTVREIDGSMVTWTSNGRVNGDPVSGWFGILMPSMLGPAYDYGLSNLNELCAKKNGDTKPIPSSDSTDTDESDSALNNQETQTSDD